MHDVSDLSPLHHVTRQNTGCLRLCTRAYIPYLDMKPFSQINKSKQEANNYSESPLTPLSVLISQMSSPVSDSLSDQQSFGLGQNALEKKLFDKVRGIFFN